MSIAAAVASKVRRQVEEHTRHAVERWRAMALEIATGSGSPRPAEVITVAAALGIPDPGVELERDAAVAGEHSGYMKTAAAVQENRAKRIAAAGGIENVQAALAVAEREVSRLKELLDDLTTPHESFYQWAAWRLERENPRLFGEWPRPRPNLDEVEDCE